METNSAATIHWIIIKLTHYQCIKIAVKTLKLNIPNANGSIRANTVDIVENADKLVYL